ATFLAGVFELWDSRLELAHNAEWFGLRITVEGQPLSLAAGEDLEHRRGLDLKRGLLWREWRHRDAAGGIPGIHFLRLAPLADRHTLLQAVAITPENYSGRLGLEASLRPLEERGGVQILPPSALSLRAAGTGLSVAFAAAGQLL